ATAATFERERPALRLHQTHGAPHREPSGERNDGCGDRVDPSHEAVDDLPQSAHCVRLLRFSSRATPGDGMGALLVQSVPPGHHPIGLVVILADEYHHLGADALIIIKTGADGDPYRLGGVCRGMRASGTK